METVQQNGRFTLFSSKFLSIYSILYVYNPPTFSSISANLNFKGLSTFRTFAVFTLQSILVNSRFYQGIYIYKVNFLFLFPIFRLVILTEKHNIIYYTKIILFVLL